MFGMMTEWKRKIRANGSRADALDVRPWPVRHRRPPIQPGQQAKQVAIQFLSAERFSVPITTRSAAEDAEGIDSQINLLTLQAHEQSGGAFPCSQYPASPVAVAHPGIDFEIRHGRSSV